MVGQEPQVAATALEGTRRLLRYHQVMGISGYPLNDNVRHFLRMTETGPRKDTSVSRTIDVPADTPVPSPGEEISSSRILEMLMEEIRRCNLCRLASVSPVRVCGRGQIGSRLLVVGDWSQQVQEFSPETLFGPEEDVMLWKMVEAIALRPEDVSVTNVIKCCPGNDAPDQACWQSCVSFLHREIAAIRPHLICAMGEVATAMLIGNAEPLFRLRGRFGIYKYQTGKTVPVMPTFHPRYLLRNPEMKMATWKDLQAIRRRLDQLVSVPRT